jgi:hypothetical protein
MEKLFGKGEVDHFIEHFGLGDERWNSEVFFGGRYRLTMQVEIEVDHSKHLIHPRGTAAFYLVQYNQVNISKDGRAAADTGLATGLDEHYFASDKWDVFYESSGDLAVLGVQENKVPVPQFDEIVRQFRKDRLPVISLLRDEPVGSEL